MASLLSMFKKEIKREELIVPQSKSVKEANRILNEIEELARENISDTPTIRVFTVDATSLKKTHLVPLLVFSKQKTSMASYITDTYFVRVEAKEMTETPSIEEEKAFQNWLGMGSGNATDYLKEATEEHVLYIAQELLRIMDEKIVKIEKSNTEVVSYLEKAKVDTKLSVARSSFRLRNTNVELKTFIVNCFNPIQKTLDPYSSINPSPSFQRDLVWSVGKKQDFIDSIIRELPLGAFYVNRSIHDLELGEGAGSLLWDGKQRVHAIYSFLKDEFTVSVQGEEYYYSQISSLFNEKLRQSYITVMESEFETMEEVVEAYVIINQKQIRHTDEDLEKAKQALLIKKEKYDAL